MIIVILLQRIDFHLQYIPPRTTNQAGDLFVLIQDENTGILDIMSPAKSNRSLRLRDLWSTVSIKEPSMRLQNIIIENYKGIDYLSIPFPTQAFPNDPDILVMGSRNGVGKTSVLECCALIIICLRAEEKKFKLSRYNHPINPSSYFVKAGTDSAKIQADVVVNDEEISNITILINSNGTVKITAPELPEDWIGDAIPEDDMVLLINGICGFFPNPIIKEPLLFFHSYRQINVGNPPVAFMVNSIDVNLRMTPTIPSVNIISDFKLLIYKLFISKRDHIEFEGESEKDHQESLDQLEKLVKSYAGRCLEKIKFLKDSRTDFIFKSDDGGQGISLDGLSSGEKEIIATLFMIWHYTRDSSSIVLIDEPELHLNAQWHRRFITELTRIAPGNQYFIATHSADIMGSVQRECRILLRES